MKAILSGSSAKFVVALLTAATTLLGHYSSSWWEPALATAVGAIAVWLVPNAQPAAAKDAPKAQ